MATTTTTAHQNQNGSEQKYITNVIGVTVATAEFNSTTFGICTVIRAVTREALVTTATDGTNFKLGLAGADQCG